MKGIAYWDKVGDKHDAQAKVLEARCRQLEDGISNVEAKSMKHMARERYTELLNMADYELDRMNYRELVGASTVENRAPCRCNNIPYSSSMIVANLKVLFV